MGIELLFDDDDDDVGIIELTSPEVESSGFLSLLDDGPEQEPEEDIGVKQHFANKFKSILPEWQASNLELLATSAKAFQDLFPGPTLTEQMSGKPSPAFNESKPWKVAQAIREEAKYRFPQSPELQEQFITGTLPDAMISGMIFLAESYVAGLTGTGVARVAGRAPAAAQAFGRAVATAATLKAGTAGALTAATQRMYDAGVPPEEIGKHAFSLMVGSTIVGATELIPLQKAVGRMLGKGGPEVANKFLRAALEGTEESFQEVFLSGLGQEGMIELLGEINEALGGKAFGADMLEWAKSIPETALASFLTGMTISGISSMFEQSGATKEDMRRFRNAVFEEYIEEVDTPDGKALMIKEGAEINEGTLRALALKRGISEHKVEGLFRVFHNIHAGLKTNQTFDEWLANRIAGGTAERAQMTIRNEEFDESARLFGHEAMKLARQQDKLDEALETITDIWAKKGDLGHKLSVLEDMLGYSLIPEADKLAKVLKSSPVALKQAKRLEIRPFNVTMYVDSTGASIDPATTVRFRIVSVDDKGKPTGIEDPTAYTSREDAENALAKLQPSLEQRVEMGSALANAITKAKGKTFKSFQSLRDAAVKHTKDTGQNAMEELQWVVGLEEFLKDKPRSKEEVVGYIKQNTPQVEMQERAEERGGLSVEENKRLAELAPKYEGKFDPVPWDQYKEYEEYIELDGRKRHGLPLYSGVRHMPTEGTNYRERIYTLPGKRSFGSHAFQHKNNFGWARLTDGPIIGVMVDNETGAVVDQIENRDEIPDTEGFSFRPQKTLQVEEFQGLTESQEPGISDKARDFPFLPAEKAYGFMIRDILKYAAENGYTQVVFPTGWQVAEKNVGVEQGAPSKEEILSLFTKNERGDLEYKLTYLGERGTLRYLSARGEVRFFDSGGVRNTLFRSMSLENLGDRNGLAQLMGMPQRESLNDRGKSLARVYDKILPRELKKLGIDLGTQDGQPTVQLTPEVAAKTKEFTLFQESQGTLKGRATFISNGKAFLELFAQADEMTLLHEMAHVFFMSLPTEELQVLADTLSVDLEALQKFQQDPTSLSKQELVQLVKAQEHFARGAEQFMTEGKAPNTAQQRLFDNFKRWGRNIYGSVNDIPLPMHENIRQMFQRLMFNDNTAYNGEIRSPEGAKFPIKVEDGRAYVMVKGGKLRQMLEASRGMKPKGWQDQRIVDTAKRMLQGRTYSKDKEYKVDVTGLVNSNDPKYDTAQRDRLAAVFGGKPTWVNDFELRRMQDMELNFQWSQEELDQAPEQELNELATRFNLPKVTKQNRKKVIPLIREAQAHHRRLREKMDSLDELDYHHQRMKPIKAAKQFFGAIHEAITGSSIEEVRTVDDGGAQQEELANMGQITAGRQKQLYNWMFPTVAKVHRAIGASVWSPGSKTRTAVLSLQQEHRGISKLWAFLEPHLHTELIKEAGWELSKKEVEILSGLQQLAAESGLLAENIPFVKEDGTKPQLLISLIKEKKLIKKVPWKARRWQEGEKKIAQQLGLPEATVRPELLRRLGLKDQQDVNGWTMPRFFSEDLLPVLLSDSDVGRRALAKKIAEINGYDAETEAKVFEQLDGLHQSDAGRKMGFEVMRSYPKMPTSFTYAHDGEGVRVQVLENDPAYLANAVASRMSQRLSFVSMFPQDKDELNKIVKDFAEGAMGMNSGAYRTQALIRMFKSLNGVPLVDKVEMFGIPKLAMQPNNPAKFIHDMTQAAYLHWKILILGLAGPVQIFEPLGSLPSMIGWRTFANTLWNMGIETVKDIPKFSKHVLKKTVGLESDFMWLKEARNQAITAGAVKEDVIRYSLRPGHALNDLMANYGAVMGKLTLLKDIIGFHEVITAAGAGLWLKKLRARGGREFDRQVLKQLKFQPEEIAQAMKGDIPPDSEFEYQILQRFVSKTLGTHLATAERTRLQTSYFGDNVFTFTSFMAVRFNFYAGLWDNFVKAETKHERAVAAVRLASTTVGTTFSGMMGMMLRGFMKDGMDFFDYFFDFEDEEGEFDPMRVTKFLANSWAAGAIASPYSSLLYGFTRNPEQGAVINALRSFSIVGAAQHYWDLLQGTGRYYGWEPTERLADFIFNRTSMQQAVRTHAPFLDTLISIDLLGEGYESREMKRILQKHYHYVRKLDRYRPMGEITMDHTKGKKIEAMKDMRNWFRDNSEKDKMKRWEQLRPEIMKALGVIDGTPEERRNTLAQGIVTMQLQIAIPDRNKADYYRYMGEKDLGKVMLHDAVVSEVAKQVREGYLP